MALGREAAGLNSPEQCRRTNERSLKGSQGNEGKQSIFFWISGSSITCFWRRPAACGPKNRCSCQLPTCLCWLWCCIWAARQDRAPVAIPYTQDTATCKRFLGGLMLPNSLYRLAFLWPPCWNNLGWGNSIPLPSPPSLTRPKGGEVKGKSALRAEHSLG